jgi:hypothetical protein
MLRPHLSHGFFVASWIFLTWWRENVLPRLNSSQPVPHPAMASVFPDRVWIKLITIQELQERETDNLLHIFSRQCQQNHPEDGGGNVLQISGILSQHYTASQPRRHWLESSPLWESSNLATQITVAVTMSGCHKCFAVGSNFT